MAGFGKRLLAMFGVGLAMFSFAQESHAGLSVTITFSDAGGSLVASSAGLGSSIGSTFTSNGITFRRVSTNEIDYRGIIGNAADNYQLNNVGGHEAVAKTNLPGSPVGPDYVSNNLVATYHSPTGKAATISIQVRANAFTPILVPLRAKALFRETLLAGSPGNPGAVTHSVNVSGHSAMLSEKFPETVPMAVAESAKFTPSGAFTVSETTQIGDRGSSHNGDSAFFDVVATTAIPEPGSIAMLAGAFLTFGLSRFVSARVRNSKIPN